MLDCSDTSQTRKGRCVVILGAGASRPKPYCIPTANQLLSSKEAGEMRERYPEFDQQINALANTLGDGKNLEHILTEVTTAVEISKALTKPNDQDALDAVLSKFRGMLYLLIKNSIMLEPVPQGGPMKKIFEFSAGFEHTTWCTFNWDRVLETAFYTSFSSNRRQRRNLILDEKVKIEKYWTNVSNRNLLLKLHGSIYWWYSENRENSLRQLNYVDWAPTDEDDDDNWRKFNHVWEKFEKAVTTQESLDTIGAPAILEPSAHKYRGPIYEALKSQWDRFEEELKKANTVIIIGYSLPEEDKKAYETMKILASRATEVDIIIIDRDKGVKKNYEALLGNGNFIFIDEKYNIIENIDDAIEMARKNNSGG